MKHIILQMDRRYRWKSRFTLKVKLEGLSLERAASKVQHILLKEHGIKHCMAHSLTTWGLP